MPLSGWLLTEVPKRPSSIAPRLNSFDQRSCCGLHVIALRKNVAGYLEHVGGSDIGAGPTAFRCVSSGEVGNCLTDASINCVRSRLP